MAKEEKVYLTSDQLVVQMLGEVKNELALVSKELQEKKEALEVESSMHKELLDLVIRALKGSKIEVSAGGMISIYIKERYLNSYFEEPIEEEKDYLSAFKVLIEMVNAIPTREE